MHPRQLRVRLLIWQACPIPVMALRARRPSSSTADSALPSDVPADVGPGRAPSTHLPRPACYQRHCDLAIRLAASATRTRRSPPVGPCRRDRPAPAQGPLAGHQIPAEHRISRVPIRCSRFCDTHRPLPDRRHGIVVLMTRLAQAVSTKMTTRGCRPPCRQPRSGTELIREDEAASTTPE